MTKYSLVLLCLLALFPNPARAQAVVWGYVLSTAQPAPLSLTITRNAAQVFSLTMANTPEGRRIFRVLVIVTVNEAASLIGFPSKHEVRQGVDQL